MSGLTHPSGEKQRIGVLVFEPEMLLHPLLRMALEPHGFDLKMVETLEEGLDLLTKDRGFLRISLIAGSFLGEKPDQAIVALRGVKPALVIVVMTGDTVTHAPDLLFKLGVSQVLRKPFMIAELLRVVKLAAAETLAAAPTSTAGRSAPENTA